MITNYFTATDGQTRLKPKTPRAPPHTTLVLSSDSDPDGDAPMEDAQPRRRLRKVSERIRQPLVQRQMDRFFDLIADDEDEEEYDEEDESTSVPDQYEPEEMPCDCSSTKSVFMYEERRDEFVATHQVGLMKWQQQRRANLRSGLQNALIFSGDCACETRRPNLGGLMYDGHDTIEVRCRCCDKLLLQIAYPAVHKQWDDQ